MTVFASTTTTEVGSSILDVRCPACGRPFLDSSARRLPTGRPYLAREEAVCPCGARYRLAYRQVPTAEDERQAAEVRHWRQAIRIRSGLERVAAEAAARHLGVRA
jgi:hypothetical protein